jgi:hypothetical protein
MENLGPALQKKGKLPLKILPEIKCRCRGIIKIKIK